MNIKIDFTNLKYLRKFEGMKGIELSNVLGISKSYLSHIENGSKIPSYNILYKYCNYFEIKMSDLFLILENIEVEEYKIDLEWSYFVSKILEWKYPWKSYKK